MRVMKKFTTVILTICLLAVCFSVSVFAADGKIMFTDPTVKAGEKVEVTGVVQKDRGNFGKISITMKYDTQFLKFASGDGVTEAESGKLIYTGDATRETGNRKEFKFSFTALKEGTTKIEITDSTIQNVSGNVLDYNRGASTITIQAGEGVQAPEGNDQPTQTVPVSDATVDVDGAKYFIANEIPEQAIPEGYEASKLDYDMVEYNAVFSEEFGLTLLYLVDEQNAGQFFMYVEDDATFVPYEEVAISDSVKIVLLSDVTDISLPEVYKTTTVVLNGHEFPAWQQEDAEGFCVIYALNNHGEKSLYQFDTMEATYQRFVAPQESEEVVDDSLVGKISGLVEKYMDYVIPGIGIALIIFILVIIILGVKLYNRNAELDEIYEEYGIDLDEDEETKEDAIDVDDEEEEDESEEDESEVESLLQEGLQEIFANEQPDEVEEDIILTVEEASEAESSDTIRIPIEKVAEMEQEKEDTLGEALAKQQESENESKDEFFDDDDEFLNNFSIDFIDLDDE